MDYVSASNQCREERSINGMALVGFVYKKFTVRAFHECDISCERGKFVRTELSHQGGKT